MNRTVPTIKDIASQCGVSVSTVSKALNPNFRSGVRDKLRKRILREAEKAGYRPNWVARAMINRRKHIVGLVYSGNFPLQEGNFHEMVSAMSAELQRAQYYVLFLPSQLLLDDSEAVFERVDGFILLNGKCEEDVLQEINHRGFPLVVLNGTVSAQGIKIENDDEYGAKILTEHFIQNGHQNIAYYIGRNPSEKLHYSVKRRQLGYEDAMKAAGLDKNIRVITDTYTHLANVIKRGEESTPTALMVHSHVLAINLVGELAQRGVQIPQDIAIATFNDIYPIDHLVPPLTAVAIPAEEMGKVAAEHILNWIDNADSITTNQSIMFQPRFILRQSSDYELTEPGKA